MKHHRPVAQSPIVPRRTSRKAVAIASGVLMLASMAVLIWLSVGESHTQLQDVATGGREVTHFVVKSCWGAGVTSRHNGRTIT